MRTWEAILAVVLVCLIFIGGLLRRLKVRTWREAVGEFALWVAEGFGVGQFPWAPGTFGSVVGIGWFWLLLNLGGYVLYLGAWLGGVALSVWLCGLAEQKLRKKDPSSVVLDEITAMPLCFLVVVWFRTRHGGSWPDPAFFFSGRNWFTILAVFAGFRLFDVWKPWPVRQSQSLRGGWGITIDDQLAALYVNVAALAISAAHALLGR